MNPIEILAPLAGRWRGTSHLFLEPGSPGRPSPSTAAVTPVARGKFVRLDYTWEEGGPQEGSYLFGFEKKRNRTTAAFVDSWHMSDVAMVCEGDPAEGRVDVLGHYAAPPGPDWGWRTTLAPEGSGFRLRMFNLSPEGQEDLAVDCLYERDG